MMFSGFPFMEPMQFAHFAGGRDPAWASSAPSMGCRSQSCANPGYVTMPVTVAPPAVRRAVTKPQVLESSNRIRIVRNQQEVALLIELPGFSRDEMSIQVKDKTLAVCASTSPSYYYRFGATFEENFRLGDNIDADAISATFQGGVLTLRLPYKALKTKGPRRVPVEGPSSPRLTARRSTSPPASPAAAAITAQSPIQPHRQEEWADVHKYPDNHHQEQKMQEKEEVKQPALPAKETVTGQLPAFEPVLQFVGDASVKKDININDTNTAPMSAEEKAAAWVADLEEDDDNVEDGSIEECEV